MKKTAKAWAVVNIVGGVAYEYQQYCVFRRKQPANDNQLEERGELVLPCTITYDLPKKRAKK